MEEKRSGFIDIDKRLRGVETQLAALVAIKELDSKHILDLVFENRKDIDSCVHLLSGNGDPEKGITTRIISLEETRKINGRHLIALWTLISGVFIKVSGDFISKIVK